MIKKILLKQQYLLTAIAVVCFALAGISTVFAQENSLFDKAEAVNQQAQAVEADIRGQVEERQEKMQEQQEARLEAQAERQEERAQAQTERQEDRAERVAALSERVQERIINLTSNMANRMEAAINRLYNIADRMESRAQKLAEQGVDIDETVSYINEARAHLAAAELVLYAGDIDEEIIEIAGSENPRELFSSVKAQFQESKRSILAARDSLRNALAALKAAVAEAELERGRSAAVSEGNEDDGETEPEEDEDDTDEDAE